MGHPRVSLYVDEWPEFDRQLWQQAIRSGDPLEVDGAAGHWTKKTKIQVSKDYGRFLYWLNSNGLLESVNRPVDRLTKANAAGYIKNLQETGMASVSLLSRIRNLEQAFRVMEPDADIPFLKPVIAKLKARAEPSRHKETRVVEPALLIDRALKFYDDIIRTGLPIAGRRAHQARDALMLALLAFRPIRLETFTTLSLGTNLTAVGDGYVLHLFDDETKEHLPYTVPIADQILPYLKHYLELVRPGLLKGSKTERLWISMRGTAVSESTIYYQITKITKKVIGHAINPHLFRDCVMTSIANHRPENVLAGARLLGHNSLKTSEKHYNQATSIAASRQYISALEKLRKRQTGNVPRSATSSTDDLESRRKHDP